MSKSRVRSVISFWTWNTSLRRAMLGVLALLVLGTSGFCYTEGWGPWQAFYLTLVTLTTVGYGDISPQTEAGQAIAALIMVLGYGIIAVPTGIVTAELVHPAEGVVSGQACPDCGSGGHRVDSRFCRFCGSRL